MSERMAYIGINPCGCVTFVAVDAPEYAADNAKEIARVIRSGRNIERVPVDEARERFVIECPHSDSEPEQIPGQTRLEVA